MGLGPDSVDDIVSFYEQSGQEESQRKQRQAKKKERNIVLLGLSSVVVVFASGRDCIELYKIKAYLHVCPAA